MQKIKVFFKSLRSYDYVLVSFFALSVGLTVLFYRASVIRLIQSLWDLCLSVAFYFCSMFDHEDLITPTVSQLPDIDVLDYLPYDFDEILRKLRDMWSVIFDRDCFMLYLRKVAIWVDDFAVLLMLGIMIVPLLWFVIKSSMLSPNVDKHGEKTKAQARFEGKPLDWILAAREWIRNLYQTYRSRKIYFYPITLVWLLNFNILSIAVSFLAYYFYFAMAFDFKNLFSVQLCRILLDLVIMFAGAPFGFWIVVGYILTCMIRSAVGYDRLENFEKKIREFIRSCPICILICGLMGSKKTTMVTDIALSCEVMMREDALGILMDQDAKYPNFPWIILEDELKAAFKHHRIYSLTTAKAWIRRREERFLRCPKQRHIFGYDFDRYRYEYDNKLRVETLWDSLEHYAQAYLIYTIESSVILANYSIRSDGVLIDAGNFPIWKNDFFRKDPRTSQADSRFAHILDYDLLRLGRQMLDDNPNRGSFEFGVVVMTEIGKERGNSLTLQELKKKVDECNQKNDLFNYSLKMARHKATVCNIPFIRIIADEQRPESLGADARDLYCVIHIRESSPFRLVMPFFFIEEIIHGLLNPWFRNFNVQYKASRGDTCLPFSLLHNAMSAMHNGYTNTYNLFGISELKCEIEAGTLDGDLKPMSYYISSKKDYSERFATDCHRQHFEKLLKNALVGLDDYPVYESVFAQAFEFKQQNSYFINDLENVTAA